MPLKQHCEQAGVHQVQQRWWWWRVIDSHCVLLESCWGKMLVWEDVPACARVGLLKSCGCRGDTSFVGGGRALGLAML